MLAAAEVVAGSAAWIGRGFSCVCAQRRDSDGRPSFDLTPAQVIYLRLELWINDLMFLECFLISVAFINTLAFRSYFMVPFLFHLCLILGLSQYKARCTVFFVLLMNERCFLLLFLNGIVLDTDILVSEIWPCVAYVLCSGW